jgi:hypothetical protein
VPTDLVVLALLGLIFIVVAWEVDELLPPRREDLFAAVVIAVVVLVLLVAYRYAAHGLP